MRSELTRVKRRWSFFEESKKGALVILRQAQSITEVTRLPMIRAALESFSKKEKIVIESLMRENMDEEEKGEKVLRSVNWRANQSQKCLRFSSPLSELMVVVGSSPNIAGKQYMTSFLPKKTTRATAERTPAITIARLRMEGCRVQDSWMLERAEL